MEQRGLRFEPVTAKTHQWFVVGTCDGWHHLVLCPLRETPVIEAFHVGVTSLKEAETIQKDLNQRLPAQ